MPKESTKTKIEPKEFFVVPANVANAIVEHLNQQPYGSVAKLVQAFGSSKNMEKFFEENEI